MRRYLYIDLLAVIGVCISIAAVAMTFDRVSDPPGLLYASTTPALLLPGG